MNLLTAPEYILPLVNTEQKKTNQLYFLFSFRWMLWINEKANDCWRLGMGLVAGDWRATSIARSDDTKSDVRRCWNSTRCTINSNWCRTMQDYEGMWFLFATISNRTLMVEKLDMLLLFAFVCITLSFFFSYFVFVVEWINICYLVILTLFSIDFHFKSKQQLQLRTIRST